MSETIVRVDILGMSIMIVNSFLYLITFVIFKILGSNRNHYEITYYQNLAAVPIFFVIIVLKLVFHLEDYLIPISLPGFGNACLNGLLIVILGFVLYFKGLKKVPASLASQLAFLDVIFPILWGIFLYKERLGITFIIGAVLIISGGIGWDDL